MLVIDVSHFDDRKGVKKMTHKNVDYSEIISKASFPVHK